MSPEHSTRHERRQFQTEVLTVVMDHMLAVDILLGSQGMPSTSIGSSGGNYQHLSCNVFYLAGRVVDKLWQGEQTCLNVVSVAVRDDNDPLLLGAFMRDPNEVFEFINLLISQAKRKGRKCIDAFARV